MRHSSRTLSGLFAALLVVATATAQMPKNMPMPPGAVKKPGELWRQKMSMRMGGMSIPGRSSEFCAPKENPEQQQPEMPSKNCRMYDMKMSGNKMSAKFSCTGEDAMDGTIETSRQGNTMIMDMVGRNKDGEMAMHGESTRIGTACEYVDYSGVKLEQPAIVQAPDVCELANKKLKEDPASLTNYTSMFIGRNGQCKGKEQIKEYCALTQTHGGFYRLHYREAFNERMIPPAPPPVPAGGKKKKPADPVLEMDPADRTPLTASLAACGLGQGAAGVEALKAKLLPTAEAKNAWSFMVAEGDDSMLKRLQEIAQKNCTGRGFTEAKAAKFNGLCVNYGPDLIAGRYDKARDIAWGREFSDYQASSGGVADDGSRSNGAKGAADPPAGEQPENTNKAKETLDKGKKLLRGILGR